ncbi:MAG: hypothetical protein WCP19_06905 [Chloroflexota bacterium]
MQSKSFSMLLPVILVWLISLLAGISFLVSAAKEKNRPALKGWRKFFQELRFRLSFAAGVALILWVISGIFWVIIN